MKKWVNIQVLSAVAAVIVTARPASAQIRDMNAWMSLVSRVSTVSDLRRSDSTSPPDDFGTTYDVEVGLRLRNYFQWIFTGYKTEDSLRYGYGTGFRVDTPGFFWMGGRDYRRFAKRNYPVNTSIFAVLMQSMQKNETTNLTDISFDSNMGLAIDIFLFNRKVFLTLQGSVLGSGGNSFSMLGGGLGLEF